MSHPIEDTPRYPLDALAAALRIDLHQPGRPNDDQLDAGLTAIAFRLGVSLRYVRRLANQGLTDRQADRYAIRCGMHPATIWTTWWDNAESDEEWYSDDPPMRPPRKIGS